MTDPQNPDLPAVAILSMAGRFPGAADPEALWRLVEEGREAIRRFSAEELEASSLGGGAAGLDTPGFVPAGGVLDRVESFDAAFFSMTPREAEITDPQHRLLLECAWEAFERAGRDPERLGPEGGGNAGVFVGTGLNTYFMHNVLAHPEVLASVPHLQVMIGADKDYVAPLLAYKLDLKGPAVSLQTACSTSLVAVHLACQSLLDYQCDLALAGGASVRVPQRAGYRYQEGGIYSPDGHCRPFDAAAQGTVIGSGAGMVLLKRLDEALADGDPIVAVIRGSAVNNDGAAKVGFTAPGLDGQVRVISEALAAAGVPGASLSYVEAHGTGTKLGDPIEVEALGRALGFGAVGGDGAGADGGEPGRVTLGSLKSNTGHLDTAAGVAGLIKAALALGHRRLPPTAHFERPSGEIAGLDPETGPFRVLAEAAPWPAPAGRPRRAGVSSFGIGGTNAHVILEEAPERPASPPPERPWQLLVWSARSAAALEAASAGLAEHLEGMAEQGDPTGARLADAAWTLQVGRRRFPHRRAAVVRSAADAARLLAGEPSERLLTRAEAGRDRPVVFLLPGQGAQYPGMARGLYESEPAFRHWVDVCAEELTGHLEGGLDLRTVLFPEPGTDPEEAARRLEDTALAQPALFTVEYALARLWMEWLGDPEALLGHSIGEWVAACLAGVWTLPDALALVALRGRLMGALPAGRMLSVNRGEEALLPLLEAVNGHLDGGGRPEADRVALAAVNAPGLTVVSGSPEAIAAFEAQVADWASGEEGAAGEALPPLEAKPLHTSHAFHSAMMDPVLPELTEALARVEALPPEIPFLSNRTGTWITDGEATDPAYWAAHLRGTVRFADGLGALLGEPGRIFLEVGPGRALSILARRTARALPGAAGREVSVVSSLRRAQEAPASGEAPEDEDQRRLLEALGRLWLAGATVDWHGLCGDEGRRRVRLPTYPFERQRYWLEPRAAARVASASVPAETTPEVPEVEARDRSAGEASPEPAVDGPEAPAGHERPSLDTPYVAPRDAVEERIARVWGGALGLRSVGVLDDFFELGGHSLLATQISVELRRAFRAELALSELFENPTVAAMAEAIRPRLEAGGPLGEGGEDGAGAPETVSAAVLGALPEIVPDPERGTEPFPLTDVQQAYWIGRSSSFDLGGVATHVYWELEAGDLDLPRLEAAFNALIRRQAMLRAIVREDGRQQILPVSQVGPYRIAVQDLTEASDAEAEAALAAVRKEMSHQMLPADTWPLFQVRASRRRLGGPGGEGEERDTAGEARTGYRFHVSFDLLIGDAWSWQIIGRELVRLYVRPENPGLAPLELTFRDYVLALRRLEEGPAFERDLAYWRSRLETLPPAPELPLARSPGELGKPEFIRLARRLPPGPWRRLKERARRAGLTQSGLLLAAFSEVLAAWSKSPRFTLNLTLFNRLPLHPQVNRLIGDFTSLTLLAVEHDRGQTFTERARAVQSRLWEDLDHRLVSGVRVMRELARARGARTAGLMPVVFTSTLNTGDRSSVAGGGDQAAGVDPAAELDEGATEAYAISQTPQVWIDHQVQERRGGLHYNWDAVENLFPEGLLRDMFEVYARLLRRLADEDEPWRSTDLDLLPTAQKAARLAVNATEAPVPQGLLQGPLRETLAGLDPAAAGRPAILTPERTVTYGELGRRSRALARRLRRRLGTGREVVDTLVAVVMEKGWEQVVAALAVVEAGAAYLPIDAALPPERRRQLLESGRVRVALVQERLAEAEGFGGAAESVAAGTEDLDYGWPAGVERWVVREDEIEDAGAEAPAGAPDAPLPPLATGPEDLAYVIFTSGSTGVPKGVMIEHRSALNTVVDINRRFRVGPEDRVLGLSSLSFDLSVYDLFGVLGAGGALVLPDPERQRDPAHWAELAEAHGVTVWNTVPALMEVFTTWTETAGRTLPPSLRLVMMSGDWIPLTLPGRIHRASAPSAPSPIEVISLGGATEGSIWSNFHPVPWEGEGEEEREREGKEGGGGRDPEWPSIPYGRPLSNQTFHVVRSDLAPRPDWVPGELAIGGLGVARGYWDDPEKTARHFVRHPETGERLYRTGDLGRYRPGAILEFLGREDTQVKIRGYRVELGEIEAALMGHPEVQAGVVVAWSDDPRPGSPRRLVAYVVATPPEGGGQPVPPGTPRLPDGLREHLAESLPEYMIPSFFVPLLALPLTTNGKVDRSALPAPERVPAGGGTLSSRPLTDVEEVVQEICCEVLGLESLGLDESFFDVGGDSLSAIRTTFQVRERLGLEVPVRRVFEGPTVAELAEVVEAALLAEIESLSEDEVRAELG